MKKSIYYNNWLDLGERNPFKAARVRNKLSKTRICRESGISWNTLTSMEKNEHYPSYETLNAWFAAFNVNLNDFISECEYPEDWR